MALRLCLAIPAGLTGVVIGFALTLIKLITDTARPDGSWFAAIGQITITIYASSALFALALGTLGAFLALRAVRDPHAERTAAYVPLALLAGGIIAVFAGIGTAALFDFDRPQASFPTVVVVVLTVLGAAIALARRAAVRRGSNSAEDRTALQE